MTSVQIAETILYQLGGNRFAAMTGAKNFCATRDSEENPSLSMQLGRNAGGWNRCTIALNGRDLYNVTFEKVPSPAAMFRGAKVKSETHVDIYAEDLAHLFLEATGLYTSL